MRCLIALALMIFAAPAFAGDRNKPTDASAPVATAAQAQGQTQAQAQRQRATSRSDATINQTLVAGPGGATTPSGRDGRAPDVIPPAISTANTCAVGLSLGGAGVPGGGAFGLTWEDDGCARRATAGMLWLMGHKDAAVDLLACNDMKARYALANAGTPCKVDRDRWIKEGWRP